MIKETKEKVIQDEEILLYKPYTISLESSKPNNSEPTSLQDKIENLEKVLKTLQSITKIILFLPPSHYNQVHKTEI